MSRSRADREAPRRRVFRRSTGAGEDRERRGRGFTWGSIVTHDWTPPASRRVLDRRPRMRPWRRLPRLVTALAVSMLGGCLGSPAPGPSPSPAPRRGGVFRFTLTEPRGLDPAYYEDA